VGDFLDESSRVDLISLLLLLSTDRNTF